MQKLTKGYFLPYQVNYINDNSRFKFVEKSRRIGMTYAESYSNAKDCALGNVKEVWFSSADLSAAEEFIEYIKFWNDFFEAAAKDSGEILIDKDNDVRAHRIKYASGSELNVISSNPSKFRSKGGRVILDEFAHHHNQEKLFAAAKPSTMWGAELRIISTHNGNESFFNQLSNEIAKGSDGKMKNWKKFTITINDAIKDGLVEKILRLKRKATDEEIAQFLEDAFSGMTQEAIDEEFYCIPRSSSDSHLLSYELINAVERDNILKPLIHTEGNLYAGFDVARKKHLSCLWVTESIGELDYTRAVIEMRDMPFRKQKEILYEVLSLPNLRRCCIDASGLGMQLAEEALEDYGKFKVEPISFTNSTKEELATNAYVQVENQRVLIPRDRKIRDDFYSIKAVITAAGNTRYEAEETEDGHADRFWAFALNRHARKSNAGPVNITSGSRRNASNILRNYLG
jgi:phage FluMu gp28-like protein